MEQIFFVGGEFEKSISGAEQMRNFFEKISKNKIPLQVLGSNDSESNIEIIANILKNDSGIVITSSYHLKRMKKMMLKLNFHVEICSAEEMILQYGDEKSRNEIEKYLISFPYRIKELKEFILIILADKPFFKKIMKIKRKNSYR